MQRYSYFLILQIFTRFFIRKYFSFIFCAFLKMYFRLWNEDNRWHYEWRRRVGKHVPWADKIIYLCLLTDWGLGRGNASYQTHDYDAFPCLFLSSMLGTPEAERYYELQMCGFIPASVFLFHCLLQNRNLFRFGTIVESL